MSEDIEDNLWDLLNLNTYLDLDNEMKEKSEIPREVLKRWFENSKGLLDLYQKEKEKREIAEENHKVLSLDIAQACKELGLYEDTIIADELVVEINKKFISKDKIKEKMEEVKNLSTAGYEILKELLEGKNEDIN